MFHEKILAKNSFVRSGQVFMNGSIKSVILAAGKGTRMKSEKAQGFCMKSLTSLWFPG